MRKKLDRVTLVIVDCVNIGQAVYSLQKSLEQIEPTRTIFFTDIDLNIKLPDVEIIKIPHIDSKQAYSLFIVKELWKYIETDFVLITQWDSGVLNGESWRDEFYDYDIVSPPWLYVDGRNIGNGGFSLRSQRLQAILGNDDKIEMYHPEDEIIGRLYRNYLEFKYRVKFCDDDLGDKFGFELRAPVYNTFGYHGHFHQPFKDCIVITRSGALGDVIALEPVLHYYYKKGYKVVLNTRDHYYAFYMNHYFKVHHPKELDGRVQFKEINLDMAYETFPKQLHLKSYYDMCGITDGEIRNPKLTLEYDYKVNKLFNKYVVLHLDKRNEASRNIEGIEWETVVDYLHENGYDVLQIGIGVHTEVKNAVFMNTPSEALLMAIVGSCNLFIGNDSGPSNIAVAMGAKAIIFSGSVDLRYIIPDLSEVVWMHNHDKKVCEQPFCWHDNVSCTGTECYLGTSPCNQFSTSELLTKIKEQINGI